MSLKIIPSLMRPTEIAYEIGTDGTRYWNAKGQAQLSGYIAEFRTFGDGLTQHSFAYPSQLENFSDAVVSVAAAILGEPRVLPEWNRMATLISRWPDQILRFAMSLKFREGKNQFYSLSDLKVTSANKRYDRRWEAVSAAHTGGPLSAYNMLLDGLGYPLDWIERITTAHRLRELWYQDTGSMIEWETLLPVDRLDRNWQSALQAFIHACRMIEEHNLGIYQEETAA